MTKTSTVQIIVGTAMLSSTLLLVAYQFGYDRGFNAGFGKHLIAPWVCPDRSPEGKALSSTSFNPRTNVTHCTYIRETYGKGRWVGQHS
jgi:hypothetical protein